jgi:trigger factor
MNWKVKDEGKCRKVVEVNVDKDTVKETYGKVFNSFKQNAVVEGFRKGKAPEEMIKSRYMDKIHEEVIKEVVPSAYQNVMKELNLHIVTYPSLTDVKYTTPEKDEVEFKVIVEVNPEFDVADYSKVKIDVKKFNGVKDEDVEKEIKRIRQYRGTLKQVEKDKVEEGDFADVSMSAFVDNKADASLTTESHLIQIGAGGFLKELEDGIKGMKLGEEKDISFVFPADYFNKRYAGKSAAFKVKVNAIKVLELPEFNDDFAKNMAGMQTADELKAALKTELEKRAQSDVRQHNTGEVLKKLAEQNKFDVPEGLVEQELDNIVSRYENSMKQQGISMEKMGITKEDFRSRNKKQAEENIRVMYILQKIAEKEKIEVSDADVEAEIRKIAADIKQDPEAMIKQAKAQDNWDSLRAKLTEDKVLDKMFEISGAK